MNLEKAMELLTPAQIIDADSREMLGSVKSIKAYLYEIKECEKASKRMKKIDLAISKLALKQQKARLNRIEAQRKAFSEAVYAIEKEALIEIA